MLGKCDRYSIKKENYGKHFSKIFYVPQNSSESPEAKKSLGI